MSNVMEQFGDMIFSYSRAQAIEDGVLVDVSNVAKKSGFKISVAVTSAVWDKYIEWTDEDSSKQTSQDQIGRLHDVLTMLHFACRRSVDSCVLFRLSVIPRDGRSKSIKTINLKSTIGGGDEGEPVITVMLPNED